jgi:hypothetical protein
MEKKKSLSFTFLIVAIILGVTLYKQFDFGTFKFKHTGLAIVYLVVFIGCVTVLIRNARGK